jgi:hypothetical protein
MTPEEQLKEMTKNEIAFLQSEEGDGECNEHGVYLYTSGNGNHIVSLEFYLCSYKNWLIENNIVKEVK